MHIGVFILLLLSGERNFGVRLNKPYSVRVPMDIPVFTGSHADFLIIVSLIWLRGSAVERRSLAGELSLSCARPVADGLCKPSAIGQSTRPTQPFILLGLINE